MTPIRLPSAALLLAATLLSGTSAQEVQFGSYDEAISNLRYHHDSLISVRRRILRLEKVGDALNREIRKRSSSRDRRAALKEKRAEFNQALAAAQEDWVRTERAIAGIEQWIAVERRKDRRVAAQDLSRRRAWRNGFPEMRLRPRPGYYVAPEDLVELVIVDFPEGASVRWECEVASQPGPGPGPGAPRSMDPGMFQLREGPRAEWRAGPVMGEATITITARVSAPGLHHPTDLKCHLSVSPNNRPELAEVNLFAGLMASLTNAEAECALLQEELQALEEDEALEAGERKQRSKEVEELLEETQDVVEYYRDLYLPALAEQGYWYRRWEEQREDLWGEDGCPFSLRAAEDLPEDRWAFEVTGLPVGALVTWQIRAEETGRTHPLPDFPPQRADEGKLPRAEVGWRRPAPEALLAQVRLLYDDLPLRLEWALPDERSLLEQFSRHEQSPPPPEGQPADQ